MYFVVTGNSNGNVLYSSKATRRYGISVSFGWDRRSTKANLMSGILGLIYTTASVIHPVIVSCSSLSSFLKIPPLPLHLFVTTLSTNAMPLGAPALELRGWLEV